MSDPWRFVARLKTSSSAATAFATRWREVNDERNHMLRSSEELFKFPSLKCYGKSSGITPANLEQALQCGVDEQVVLTSKP